MGQQQEAQLNVDMILVPLGVNDRRLVGRLLMLLLLGGLYEDGDGW